MTAIYRCFFPSFYRWISICRQDCLDGHSTIGLCVHQEHGSTIAGCCCFLNCQSLDLSCFLLSQAPFALADMLIGWKAKSSPAYKKPDSPLGQVRLFWINALLFDNRGLDIAISADFFSRRQHNRKFLIVVIVIIVEFGMAQATVMVGIDALEQSHVAYIGYELV